MADPFTAHMLAKTALLCAQTRVTLELCDRLLESAVLHRAFLTSMAWASSASATDEPQSPPLAGRRRD
jgi:hypothetical protein